MSLGLALALLTSVAPVCPLTEPATSEGLLLAERRWVVALEAHDVGALACRLAPGFTDTTWQGKLVGRAIVLAALPHRANSKLALSELTAEVYGRIGIVHGVNTQIGPDGKIAGKVRFTDVFVRSDGRWRALAAQETAIRSN